VLFPAAYHKGETCQIPVGIITPSGVEAFISGV